MREAFQLGLYTFGELTPDAQTGKAIGARQRLADILAAAKLADEAGLDVFAVGEHHRLDMSVSATPVVLAAIAARTERIRLASAVTILSTADPVRVFEDFSTVDLISGGRAELIVGRGVFTELFPLFGYDLADYDDLFAEKLELLLEINAAERVTWRGRFRPALHDAPVPPRPAQGRLPIWVGTGGTPGSIATSRRARTAFGARQYQHPAGAVGAHERSLPPHRDGGRPRRRRPQAEHRDPHARPGQFAGCPERFLSALCRLFPQPHAERIFAPR